MKKVVLHHTCSQENGEAFVRKNAPFLAEDNPHYKNAFFVVEFECDIEEEDILNLNEREGQKALFEMIKNIQTEFGVNLRGLPLSRIFSLIYKR